MGVPVEHRHRCGRLAAGATRASRAAKAPAGNTRYWLLGFVLRIAAATGSLAWEWVNPVSMFHRGLIFGFGRPGASSGGIFFYDLLIGRAAGAATCARWALSTPCSDAPSVVKVIGGQAQRLQRLHGLLRRVPRTPGHPARAQGRRAGPSLILDADCNHLRTLRGCVRQDVFRITTRFNREHAKNKPKSGARSSPPSAVGAMVCRPRRWRQAVKSIRGVDVADQELQIGNYKPIPDQAPIERDYVQQPPLIPHKVEGYEVTMNFSKCMIATPGAATGSPAPQRSA